MLSVINRIVGRIPYSISVTPGLLTKENHYQITSNSLHVDVQIISLDKVWQTTFKRGWNWNDFQTILASKTDTHFDLCWTPTRGWWLQGSQTGRRMRPMPKFMGALLCGALVVTFPEMLDLTFRHAENIENPFIAYGLLAGGASLICILIGWYLWLAYKAKPSGLIEALLALKEFVKRMGDDEKSDLVDSKNKKDNSSEEIDALAKTPSDGIRESNG